VAFSILGLVRQAAGGLLQRSIIGVDSVSRHALMIVNLKQTAIP
jgi:hypothetical protein